MTPDSEHRQNDIDSKDDLDRDLEPGATRFWGQVSRARAGRSQAETEDSAETAAGNDPAGAGGMDGGPDRAGTHDGECLEWCPICRSADLLRATITPELREQAEAIQKEAMNVVHAFLTAYSERTAGREDEGPDPPAPDEPDPPSRATDIPLD